MDRDAVCGPDSLNLKAWQTLSPPRRSNVLRAWLRDCTGRPAPADLVSRLMSELPGTEPASWPVPGGELRRYRGVLRWAGEAPRPGGADTRATTIGLDRPGMHVLRGWGGSVVVTRARKGGVPLAWLAHVELRPRAGGEQFQAGIGRPPRSLKKQFQAAAISSWEREGPLIYSGGQLMFVPGLGIDARVMALPGQPQATITWVPDGHAS